MSGRDREAGDRDDVGPGIAGEPARAAIVAYAIGLGLSALLTVASFYALHTRLIWGPSIPALLITLGAAQIGVHLVFFLRITTAPDETNNALALAFGVLIVGLVVVGSLWIMDHLDHNMLSTQEVMRMQR